ncbi:hypothetical protein [Methanobrevibacter millerae]|uniref:Uncharacterized protein n=1 Tax=Methanobrevibacter millerae TaxID=230361 RepID=A0A1G5VH67_9EURY|nr:hypothetical protein [Methanobrevibacter millerae]SDA45038.1 hypothetical protein SAMN02910315_00593 [Methanobrevibacter millerae]
MHKDKIKSYDELNADEHVVLDAFREMKIRYDKARIELINYRIDNLINNYTELQKIREDIRINYFLILEKINKEEFAEINIDYQEWKKVLDNEISEWNEEVELMLSLKYYFDDLLKRIKYGLVEQEIIEEERNIGLD